MSGANKDLGVLSYEKGTMHDVVYDVNGGFEDWAYGASWDTKNVPHVCEVYTSDGLLPEKIHYNDFSNRAFVYLVETGFDKTPKDDQLGNEIAVFDPDNEDAIWGHISRNTFLSLKFAEYIRPQLSIESMEYSKGLIIDFRVSGCIKLNELKIKDLSFFIISNKYEERSGNFIITVVINQINKIMRNIEVLYKCDQHWN